MLLSGRLGWASEFSILLRLDVRVSAKANIYAIYRTTGSENRSERPFYYSKELCALSFARSLKNASRVSLTVINDGEPSSALPILQPVAKSIINQERKGNAGSYLGAVELALEQGQDDDWVYFVEDDYLHTEDSLGWLTRGVDALPAVVSYMTLYEHPNNYYRGEGGPVTGPSFVYNVGTEYWHTVPSVCMTFSARLSALREDLSIHRRASNETVPDDFGLWLALQGAGFPLRFGQKFPRRVRPYLNHAAMIYLRCTLASKTLRQSRRRLVTSMPSRCTHLVADGLAPGVDWEAVATAAVL